MFLHFDELRGIESAVKITSPCASLNITLYIWLQFRVLARSVRVNFRTSYIRKLNKWYPLLRMLNNWHRDVRCNGRSFEPRVALILKLHASVTPSLLSLSWTTVKQTSQEGTWFHCTRSFHVYPPTHLLLQSRPA